MNDTYSTDGGVCADSFDDHDWGGCRTATRPFRPTSSSTVMVRVGLANDSYAGLDGRDVRLVVDGEECRDDAVYRVHSSEPDDQEFPVRWRLSTYLR